MRLIVGMSGASGVIYGVRLLEALKKESDAETHLILSDSAKTVSYTHLTLPTKRIV